MQLALAGCAALPPPAPAPHEPLAAEPPPAPIIFEREPAVRDTPSPAGAPPDAEIAAAVRDELAEGGGGPLSGGPQPQVDVRQGIVMLSGTVPSLLHVRAILDATSTVRGVRSIVPHLQVVPAPLSDAEIASRLRARLEEDPATRDVQVLVRARQGRVTLRGVADSYAEKQLAGDIARALAGVRAVVNGIEVKARPRADTDIRSDVIARLAYDAYLADDTLAVEVNRGVVSLQGAVGSLLEKQRARAAAWVRGVLAVYDDRLAVDASLRDREQRRRRPVPSDEEVARALREALALAPHIPPQSVAVRVHRGTARLDGWTPDLLGKRAAERIATNTIGVWRVDNQITVRRAARLDDAELLRLVRARLSETPWLNPAAVAVNLEDGRLTLRGPLSGSAQRRALARSLESLPGVVEVIIEPTRAPAPRVSDEQLERRIQRALWWDTRVDGSTIQVDVRRGVVLLRGQVPSGAARAAVLQNVWQARPQAVEDRLELAAGSPPA